MGEYNYHRGDPESERLKAWYEGKLGFSGSGSGFRFSRKRLSLKAIEARKLRRSQSNIACGRNYSGLVGQCTDAKPHQKAESGRAGSTEADPDAVDDARNARPLKAASKSCHCLL